MFAYISSVDNCLRNICLSSNMDKHITLLKQTLPKELEVKRTLNIFFLYSHPVTLWFFFFTFSYFMYSIFYFESSCEPCVLNPLHPPQKIKIKNQQKKTQTFFAVRYDMKS